MKLLDQFAKWMGYVPANAVRGYENAVINRLKSDWAALSDATPANQISSDLPSLRKQSRALVSEEDHAKRYFRLLKKNVVGPFGVGLQMKIREMVRDGQKWVSKYDTRANGFIESGWKRWGRREFCTLSRQWTWWDVQCLAVTTAARDGASIFRKHYPRSNPFRFAVEPIAADHLDTRHEANLSNGNYIRCGVEFSGVDGSIAAYHLFRNHPGDNLPRNLGQHRERVPGDQIVQLYLPESFGDPTGIPWITAAITRLRHLGKYEEAELVASRAAAAKMGFIETTSQSASPGYAGPVDKSGRKYMDVQPGSVEELPFGKSFKPFDPSHPNTSFEPFVKGHLRSVASGLDVSYMNFANDPGDANYSSARVGLLDERDGWMMVQQWFIESFITPIFEDWLRVALLAEAIGEGSYKLPAAKFDKFNAPEWKPRRWPWVDPLKDMQANVLAVEKGFTSRRQIISENGGDIEEVFADQQADEALAEEHGLDFSPDSGQQANAQSETPDKPDDPEKAANS